jgi:hypothetical protein
MLNTFRPIMLAAMMIALPAAAPRSPNLLRDAFSPIVTLEPEKSAVIKGETDGDEPVSANLNLTKEGGIESLTITQDDRPLALHATAIQGLTGATRAWLEERGALTTLVVEGTEAGKDWRMALEFHPKRLWLKRVSREGQGRDEFTYYDRDDGEPRAMQKRRHHVHGFHGD